MRYFRNILFPVDFSETCEAFTSSVAAFAQAAGAKISLLHVLQSHSQSYASVDVAATVVSRDAEWVEMQNRYFETFTARFCRSYGVEVETALEEGKPDSVITRYADQHNVDLIMMPTHGCGPFRRFLLGSVTAKVLHDAHPAVYTSAHKSEAGATQAHQSGPLLCAIGDDSGTVSVLQAASAIGSDLGKQVALVHAVVGAEPAALPDFSDFRAFLFKSARDRIAELQKAAGTEFEVCLHAGNVADVVRDAALRHEADFVIIGRNKLHAALGYVRSHAYGIITHAPCAVMAI